MKRILLLAVLCLFFTGVNAPGQSSRKLTPSQGRTLVLASLNPEQRRLPGLEAELNRRSIAPKFLSYTVTWAGTKDGSVVVANYAVDPYTADVFSATIECHEERNQRLQALQARVRLRMHLTVEEYQKLKTKGPLCE